MSDYIDFDTIPRSIRTPDAYFELNTNSAQRGLSNNKQRVCLIGIAAAGVTPLALYSVTTAKQADLLFGVGSQLAVMSRAALTANPHLHLDAVVLRSDDFTRAVAKISFTTVVDRAGTITVNIADKKISIAVTAGAKQLDVANALSKKIKAECDIVNVSVSYSQSASTLTAILTLQSRIYGSAGNSIYFSVSSTTGVQFTVTQFENGGGSADIRSALNAIVAAGHNIIVCPAADRSTLIALREYLELVSSSTEQRPAIAVAASTSQLDELDNITTELNAGRITIGWYPNSRSLDCQIAAAYAAVIASEEDPARILNGLKLQGLDVVDRTQRLSRSEIERGLHSGVTPLAVVDAAVTITRSITTYRRGDALLDIITIRTSDFVARACRERVTQRFPRSKLSSRTPAKIRSEILDVLYHLENLEIIENVENNQASVVVERDAQDVNRVNAVIPFDTVNGLHIIAGRVDLIL